MQGFMKNISTIFRCATQYRSERFLQYGLNGYQGVYIINICGNDGITQEKLTRLIHVNKSNVTRQLASLEENGFVIRKQCDNDKRVVMVYPTQKAIDVLPIVHEVFHEWSEYLTADLTKEEKELALNILSKITAKAENYEEGMVNAKRGAILK